MTAPAQSPSRWRPALVIAASAVAGAIALVLLVPLLAPVDRMRQRVERVLASYLDRDIMLSGRARLRVVPAIGMELDEVQIRDRANGEVIATADHVSARVNLVQYMLGRSPIMAIHIAGPSVHGPLLPVSWPAGTAWLERLEPTTISLSDGTVHIDGDTAFGGNTVDRMDFAFKWPRAGANLQASATFRWQDEIYYVTLQGSAPARIASDRASDITLSVASVQGRIALAGQAALGDRPRFDGTVAATLADPAAVIALLPPALRPVDSPARYDLDGRLRLSTGQVMLSDFTLRGATELGAGQVSFDYSRPRPSVAGNIRLAPLTLAGPLRLADALERLLTLPVNLDMRLSLADVSLGPWQASNIAVSVIAGVTGLQAALATADVAGGTVSGRLTAQATDSRGDTKIHGAFALAGLALRQMIPPGGGPFQSGSLSGSVTVAGAVPSHPADPLSLAAQLTARDISGSVASRAAGTDTPESFAAAAAAIELRLSDGLVEVDRLEDAPRGRRLTGRYDITADRLSLREVDTRRDGPPPAGLTVSGTLARPVVTRP